MGKRGALELSLTTIIVVVLCVLFLIMGIVMLRNMSCAAMNGIQKVDDYTTSQLRDLFSETNKVAVIKQSNDIQRGVEYGVAFAIKNDGSSNNQFSYSIVVDDLGTCNIDKKTAESFILTGKIGNAVIPIDSDYSGLINMEIPSTIPSCNLRYSIIVKNGEQNYSSAYFDVNVKPRTFSSNFC